MADQRFSELEAVSTSAGTDQFAVNQGGVSKRQTLAQVGNFIFKNIPSMDAISAVEDGDSFGMYDVSSTAERKATVAQVKARILNGGQTTSYTVVSDLNKVGSMLQKKTRLITLEAGIVTSVGDESAWIDVGEFGGYY